MVVENEAGSTVRTDLSALFELGTRTSILGMFILGATIAEWHPSFPLYLELKSLTC